MIYCHLVEFFVCKFLMLYQNQTHELSWKNLHIILMLRHPPLFIPHWTLKFYPISYPDTGKQHTIHHHTPHAIYSLFYMIDWNQIKICPLLKNNFLRWVDLKTIPTNPNQFTCIFSNFLLFQHIIGLFNDASYFFKFLYQGNVICLLLLMIGNNFCGKIHCVLSTTQ